MEIAGALTWLWLFVICWVTFALTFLLTHAIIPSMVGSHHLPRRVSGVRPVLYVIALAAAAGAVTFILSWLNWLPVIYRIFPRAVI